MAIIITDSIQQPTKQSIANLYATIKGGVEVKKSNNAVHIVSVVWYYLNTQAYSNDAIPIFVKRKQYTLANESELTGTDVRTVFYTYLKGEYNSTVDV